MGVEAAFIEGGLSLVWVDVERLVELLVEPFSDTDEVDVRLVSVETELTDVELVSVV
jgi:hypothetical protein